MKYGRIEEKASREAWTNLIVSEDWLHGSSGDNYEDISRDAIDVEFV